LQARNLQKNQTEKTAKTPHWQFGRPLLGQNTGHSMHPPVLSALLEARPQRDA